MLERVVGPLVREALGSGAADRWFFIRYGDPQWHLRVRLRGSPARLREEILAALHEATAPLLADGSLWKVQLDTYERELERYGGAEGIELAERIFQADSEAVLEILEMLEPGDEGSDERWRLALAGTHSLLEDLGLGLVEKRALLDDARREFLENLRANEGVGARRRLGERFRKEAKNLDVLLDPSRGGEGPLLPGLEVLRGRSKRLAPLVEELRAREREGKLSRPLADIAPSFIHMHVNRMLRSAQRAQEPVLYEFLSRLYESRAAQGVPLNELEASMTLGKRRRRG